MASREIQVEAELEPELEPYRRRIPQMTLPVPLIEPTEPICMRTHEP
jgi:hypothetical protein